MQSNTTQYFQPMGARYVQDALLLQCMGGFKCSSRERCQHYSASPIAGRQPNERLCPKGSEFPVLAKQHGGPTTNETTESNT